MRTRLAAMAVVLSFVVTVTASAGTITSISPSSVKVNSGEHFVTVFGTGLSGGTLVFDGPAGHFERVASASFSGSIVGWVPEQVVRTSGVYSLAVRAGGVLSNTVSFTVQGFKYFPLAILNPDILFVQPLNRDGGYVKYDVYVFGGEDPNPSYRCLPASGDFFKMGSTTVTCEASNANGEKAQSSFVVHVADRVAPVVSAPREPIVVKAQSKEGAIVDFKADANDDIYGALRTECSPRAGSVFPVGKTTVQCTATDFDGNIGYAFFLVEVLGDLKAPWELLIQVPEPIYVDARDVTGADVKWEAKVVNSDDAFVELTCDHKSGERYPIGETIVTCTALDRFGLRGRNQFAITVMDPMGPYINRVIATPNVLPFDNRVYPIRLDVDVKDDLDLQPHCAIFSVTANEDIDVDDDDSEKEWDWRITGDLTLELRARYLRTMRTYNVWVGCSDWFGNMSATSVPVYVTKDGNLPATVTNPTKRRAAGKP
jgi:hypothetical protein